MTLYLISYDIADKDKDEYETLWAKLRELKAAKILYSEWIIIREHSPSGNTANDIYEMLSPLIRKGDRLLVQELAGYAAWDSLIMNSATFKDLVEKNARF
jgi:hypothetical protein